MVESVPIIVLFGYPASGKSTYSNLLSQQLGVPRISMGALLHEEAVKNTPRGKCINACMREGKMVPIPDTMHILGKRLEAADTARGFVLDGFPRSVRQAKALDKLLSSKGLAVSNAIFLGIPKVMSAARLAERRSCPKCGITYTRQMLEKGQKACRKCGSMLVAREDKKPKIIKKRIKASSWGIRGMNRYYRMQGKLVVLDARVNGRSAVQEKAKKFAMAVKRRAAIRHIK